jgi:hypothetical protein
MEDPWANAWGGSSKSILPEPSPHWSAPSVSVLHGDNEDDLSTPSWPKDVSAWGAADLPADHIWSTAEASSTWNPRQSTFEDISLAEECKPQNSSQTEIREAETYPSSSLSFHEEEAWALSKTQLQEVQPPPLHPSFPETVSIPLDATNVGRGSEVSQSSSSPTSPLAKSASAPMSEDVDGFGSFETGVDSQDKESWTPTDSTFPPMSSDDAPNWDSAWQVESEDRTSEQEDAWEAARRQKEKQDRHVARHSSPSFRSVLRFLITLYPASRIYFVNIAAAGRALKRHVGRPGHFRWGN